MISAPEIRRARFPIAFIPSASPSVRCGSTHKDSVTPPNADAARPLRAALCTSTAPQPGAVFLGDAPDSAVLAHPHHLDLGVSMSHPISTIGLPTTRVAPLS
jgi:hypothetical protein